MACGAYRTGGIFSHFTLIGETAAETGLGPAVLDVPGPRDQGSIQALDVPGPRARGVRVLAALREQRDQDRHDGDPCRDE